MNTKIMLTLVTSLIATAVFALDPPPVGSAAPDFSLTDASGKTHSLSQYNGKTVVLEWFNPECPFVKKHYGAALPTGGGRDFLSLLRRQIALSPGGTGINRQPYDAFAGVFLLQLLHVAAAVMLLHERAFGIKPFQYDSFAIVLRKGMRFAARVRE